MVSNAAKRLESRRLLGPLLVALAVSGCGTTAGSTARPLVIPTTTAPAAPTQSSPASITIPVIKVDAPLVPLGLDKNKTVMVPDLQHADQASWYCDQYKDDNGTPTCADGGVVPGDVGPASVYGHIDAHKRDGVFKRIMELNLGDPINIKRADGTTLTFKVYKVQQIPKADFVTPGKREAVAAQVYGDVPRPELRLITCTGPFVGGQVGYADQGIVYAALA
jgi:hypothetical protein